MKHPTSSACLPTPEPAPAPFAPSSHPCGSGVQVVRSPHPRRSDVLRCQPAVWRLLSPLQLGRRSPSPRPPPCPRQPRRASQSPASPVAEGLNLYPPYLKHTWRLASIKTLCAWKLPSNTALCQWTFMRPKKTRTLVWKGGGCRLGRSFDIWDALVTLFATFMHLYRIYLSRVAPGALMDCRTMVYRNKVEVHSPEVSPSVPFQVSKVQAMYVMQTRKRWYVMASVRKKKLSNL